MDLTTLRRLFGAPTRTRMNLALRPDLTLRPAVEISIAGERALCDPMGALVLPRLGLMAVSDLHLEKGSAFARRGMMLPPYDTAVTLSRLSALLDRHRPDIVVSMGDSFHDRAGATMMPTIYRESVAAMAAQRDWYWIAGNHDPDAPAGLPGRSVSEIRVAGLTFRHEPSAKQAEGEIAGHLHPGARIVRRGRSVRRRCFATDGMRLVMPAFGAFTGTLNVLDRAYHGLFGEGRLTAYVLGEERVYPIAAGMLSAG